ncbi:MAG TPA: hypothetical protein VFL91_01520, partial [Thermomicrobiales bacterium]|nr:hypothetical protein [Thermomicrobiales bacterium]
MRCFFGTRLGRVLATALVAAVAFAAGSAVVARATTAPAEIYACVSNSSGAFRLTNGFTACSKNETLLVWNTQGPQGNPGPKGPQGPKGDAGPQG